MTWVLILLTMLLATTGCTGSGSLTEANENPRTGSGAPPTATRVVIPGVPFIAWREAAQFEYADKGIMNPSAPAALGMILRYWGEDLSLLKEKDLPAGWAVEGRTATSLVDLKPYIHSGRPVLVLPALTPVAHPVDPVSASTASMKGFKFPNGGPRSGVLGQMIPLEAFRDLEALVNMKSHLESLFVASRVVIGYDESKRVLILHDPTFGPAYELGYDRFERMWGGVWGRMYVVAAPQDYGRILKKRPAAPAYLPRTPDQQAAECFVMGYAFSSIGQVAEGERWLNAGLAIPGLGTHYRALLDLELAVHALARGRREEALAWDRRAKDASPEDPRPWQFLEAFYRTGPHGGNEKDADDAKVKADALCTALKARPDLAASFPADILMFGGCPG